MHTEALVKEMRTSNAEVTKKLEREIVERQLQQTRADAAEELCRVVSEELAMLKTQWVDEKKSMSQGLADCKQKLEVRNMLYVVCYRAIPL
jgi:hypothetical protein|tara:strand:+ start:361 stop:633 length:273 start_codon:yes stop_codon:yes gene_type:complete